MRVIGENHVVRGLGLLRSALSADVRLMAWLAELIDPVYVGGSLVPELLNQSGLFHWISAEHDCRGFDEADHANQGALLAGESTAVTERKLLTLRG